LIEHVLPLLPAGTIWECAAGDGRLARAISSTGRHLIATDIAPQHSDVLLRDFLTGAAPLGCPITISNPPFKLLDSFLGRGLWLLDAGQVSGLVLLLRCDALTAAGRAVALNRESYIVTCCWRPTWRVPAHAIGRWSFCWCVWLPGCTRPLEARWLVPAHRRGDLLTNDIGENAMRAKPCDGRGVC
jgi:hypothetical protein